MSTIRQEAIKSLYLEAFPDVARYIGKKGGSENDAREIFQEAIVVYHESVLFGHKSIQTTPSAYLFGICRNLWHNHFNASIKTSSIEGIDLQEEQPHESTEKIASYLQMAGEKCMNLLQSFYYEKLSMSQLAKRFGFASERSATVQKYKCLEKVRDEVKSKSLTYEDFIA
ncbi:MAG: sigma-70 family RNA polymerase sigma factor [Marinoscillum sp.]